VKILSQETMCFIWLER